MYKRDYHPDTGLIFKTKNYGFDSPKSVPFEPLSNALVQIDAALKKEETERIAEDVRINARVDSEITDREDADEGLQESIDNLASVTMVLSNKKVGTSYDDTAVELIPVYRCRKECYALCHNRVQRNSSYFWVYIPKNVFNIEITDALAPNTDGAACHNYPFLRDTTKDTEEFDAYRTYEKLAGITTFGTGCPVIVHFTLP